MKLPAISTSLRPAPILAMWIGGFGLVGALMYLLVTGSGTVVFTLLIGGSLAALLIYNRGAALLATLGYLILMGDVRRLRDVVFPRPPLDALILVAPAVALILGIPLLFHLRLRDTLSKAMAFLLILMTLQIFNPSQGGLTVGLGGALFYLVPVMFFWIGREYGNLALIDSLIYRVLLPLSVLAAVLGLYQTFIGFPAYQQIWIDANKTTFVVLNLGGDRVRSFGFSVSPAEYATLLGIGAAAAFAACLGRQKQWLLALPALLTSLVIASSRGMIIRVAFAWVLVVAVRKRRALSTGTLVQLGILLVGFLAAISFTASHFASESSGPSKDVASAALAHQTSGLANPLDAKKSTVGLHSSMILDGFIQGVIYPVGHGLGYTTSAASKFGEEGGSSEFDMSDMFVCLGLPGGLLYLFIVFAAMLQALTFVRISPKEVGLPFLAVLSCGIGAWLIGGQYSTAALWMFMIGCANRQTEGSGKVIAKTHASRQSPVLMQT